VYGRFVPCAVFNLTDECEIARHDDWRLLTSPMTTYRSDLALSLKVKRTWIGWPLRQFQMVQRSHSGRVVTFRRSQMRGGSINPLTPVASERNKHWGGGKTSAPIAHPQSRRLCLTPTVVIWVQL